MLNLNQYKEFYKKYNKTIDQIQSPNKGLSDNQLLNKYNRYKIKEERKYNKSINKVRKGTISDNKWVEVRTRAFLLNPNAEHFFSCLSTREEKYIRNRMLGVFGILDPAHILGKQNDNLYYNVNNILICPRFFHSCIDHYTNPFTMKKMSDIERTKLFKRFVDENTWKDLALLTKS